MLIFLFCLKVTLDGYFCSSRGVYQGDLLSLLLFGLAEEFLSCYLSFLVNSNSLVPIASHRSATALSHHCMLTMFYCFAKERCKI